MSRARHHRNVLWAVRLEIVELLTQFSPPPCTWCCRNKILAKFRQTSAALVTYSHHRPFYPRHLHSCPEDGGNRFLRDVGQRPRFESHQSTLHSVLTPSCPTSCCDKWIGLRTPLQAGRPRDRSFSPGRGKISTSSRPGLKPTQPPIQWVPGIKRPRREADSSPPTSGSILHSPIRLHGAVHRDIFTFTVVVSFGLRR
jgi:hypothetical protein